MGLSHLFLFKNSNKSRLKVDITYYFCWKQKLHHSSFVKYHLSHSKTYVIIVNFYSKRFIARGFILNTASFRSPQFSSEFFELIGYDFAKWSIREWIHHIWLSIRLNNLMAVHTTNRCRTRNLSYSALIIVHRTHIVYYIFYKNKKKGTGFKNCKMVI